MKSIRKNIIALIAMSGLIVTSSQLIFWVVLYAPMVEGINPIGSITTLGILFIMFVAILLVATIPNRKRKYKSQYFMMDHDGNKISLDEDDGEI